MTPARVRMILPGDPIHNLSHPGIKGGNAARERLSSPFKFGLAGRWLAR